jgi:hypothetical protein
LRCMSRHFPRFHLDRIPFHMLGIPSRNAA